MTGQLQALGVDTIDAYVPQRYLTVLRAAVGYWPMRVGASNWWIGFAAPAASGMSVR